MRATQFFFGQRKIGRPDRAKSRDRTMTEWRLFMFFPGCPIAQPYEATAARSAFESEAPPSGGIAPSYFFGCGTPFSIVSVNPARLPLLHIQCPSLSGGPCGEPLASEPWQPLQGPLAASPRKIWPPRATWSGDDPGGVGNGRARPASGWMPSGGSGAADASATTV